jgi:hypothetical protein
MKNILILTMFLLSFQFAHAQSAESAASNHVFVMCDGLGSPINVNGQSFYLSFYSTGKVLMFCGSDLTIAIKMGATKTGTWSSARSLLWFTWSDGKRSKDWLLDDNLGYFRSGNSIMKDLGSF